MDDQEFHIAFLKASLKVLKDFAPGIEIIGLELDNNSWVCGEFPTNELEKLILSHIKHWEVTILQYPIYIVLLLETKVWFQKEFVVQQSVEESVLVQNWAFCQFQILNPHRIGKYHRDLFGLSIPVHKIYDLEIGVQTFSFWNSPRWLTFQ